MAFIASRRDSLPAKSKSTSPDLDLEGPPLRNDADRLGALRSDLSNSSSLDRALGGGLRRLDKLVLPLLAESPERSLVLAVDRDRLGGALR